MDSGFHAVWARPLMQAGPLSGHDRFIHSPLNTGETINAATAEKGGTLVNPGPGVADSAGVSGRTPAAIRHDTGGLFANGGQSPDGPVAD